MAATEKNGLLVATAGLGGRKAAGAASVPTLEPQVVPRGYLRLEAANEVPLLRDYWRKELWWGGARGLPMPLDAPSFRKQGDRVQPDLLRWVAVLDVVRWWR